MYIVIHRQTFILSQLFSIGRHVECLKLGLKPAQLYIRLSIFLLTQQATYVSSGIIRYYVVAFVYLHFALLDTRVLNSLEELCIMQVAAITLIFTSYGLNSITVVILLNIYIYIYIYDYSKYTFYIKIKIYYYCTL